MREVCICLTYNFLCSLLIVFSSPSAHVNNRAKFYSLIPTINKYLSNKNILNFALQIMEKYRHKRL